MEGEREKVNEDSKAYSSENVNTPQNEAWAILVNLAGNSDPFRG